ncbi:Gamma-D-glutamyl-L-lysine endopeptidase [termite gut metagenome]|uniref:Gamma-D-glutamyl-L-lysine endopeptidase n=1 Tax=termite gut metagenome TaxID=433724 RepID=A0A5J4RU28_9ZZZZ
MKKHLLYSFLMFLVAACTSETKFEAAFQELKSSIQKQYVPDKRVGIWDVDYRFAEGRIMLKGITTSPEAKKALITGLEAKHYQVTDSLQLLPDESALEGKIYGIVNLSVCNIRIESDFSSEMVTQALLGMPVKVLQQNEWYRIQTPDNYIGWVHRTGIVPMTKQEYNEWNTSEKLIVTSHYGFAYKSPDATSQPVSDLVAGDRLRWEGVESSFYKVSYPDGRKAYIAKSNVKPEKEWRISLNQDAESIIRTARSLMGIPYLWAGTSSKGVDCSGFVRTVLYLHDIIIPRDASQQAYVGEHIDIAPDFSNLQAGDLLFFGRPAADGKKERVIHVAIYTGNKRFIHSQGYVQTGSFDKEDSDFDEYNLNRLLFAGRILPSVTKSNNSEINTTLTNPYYQPQE